MNDLESVLIYGRDIKLLDTRSRVLQRAGFEVHVTQDLSSTKLFLGERASDLLIVCHTLPQDEQESAKVIAQTARPVTKILVMTTEAPNPNENDSLAYISVLTGPIGLIDKVKEILDLSLPA